MTVKISYTLMDDFGNRVAVVTLKQKNLGTFIINYKGKFYRPLHYDLQANVACCVPVEVINLGVENEIAFGGAREPLALVERKSA